MSDRRYSGFGARSQNTSSYHEDEPPPPRPSSDDLVQAYPAPASAIRVSPESSMYNTLYSVSSSCNTTMDGGYYYPGQASGGLSVVGDNASQHPTLSRYPTSTGAVYASQVATTYNVPSHPNPERDFHEAVSTAYRAPGLSSVGDCHTSYPPAASMEMTGSRESNALRQNYGWSTHNYGIPPQNQALPVMIGRTESITRRMGSIDAKMPAAGGLASAMNDPERNTLIQNVQNEPRRELSLMIPARSAARSNVGSPSPSSDSATPSSPVRCTLCGNEYSGDYRKGNLARHRRQKHGVSEQVYHCEDKDCSQTFKRQDARLKHYRRHHQGLADPPLARK